MSAQTLNAAALPVWTVRRRDVPPGGVRVEKRDLAPDVLAAFARAAGVDALSDFSLVVRVLPHAADGVKVEGRVTARVTQACVVTLEPVEQVIDEEVTVRFRPEGSLPAAVLVQDEDGPAIDASADGDDPMEDDRIDLAAIAAEFLTLGVDPYPRTPGAVFDGTDGSPEDHPFAALSRLKR